MPYSPNIYCTFFIINLDFFDTSMKICTELDQAISIVLRDRGISDFCLQRKFQRFEKYICLPCSASAAEFVACSWQSYHLTSSLSSLNRFITKKNNYHTYEAFFPCYFQSNLKISIEVNISLHVKTFEESTWGIQGSLFHSVNFLY